jgi:hypothetical protein
MQSLCQLSVVVPVGPGDRLAPLLRAQLGALPGAAQVSVVCADAAEAELVRGSLPTPPGPRWQCVASAQGRGVQQNAGAALSTRDWLWFLHADAALAADTLPALSRLIEANRETLAYFDLRFLDDGPRLMALNTCGAWIRSRCLGLPFGDQGLALPRALFERLGGFDESLRSGEDHDLVWRARRAGVPLKAMRAPLYTSARKYAQRGWGATTAFHLRETWRQARRFSRGGGEP